MQTTLKLLFLFLFCGIFFPLFAQKSSLYSDSVQVVKKIKKAQILTQTNYKQAFSIAQEALELAKETHNPSLIGKSQNTIGDLYWFSGDYTHASTFYFDALKNYQQTSDSDIIAECYRNIGWIYLGQNKYEQAENYFKKSLELNIQLKLIKKEIANYDDLCNLFIQSKQFENGLIYSAKSKKLAKEINYLYAYGIIHATEAQLYYGLKNFDIAENRYLTAIRILKDYPNQTYNFSIAHIGLAKVYLAKGKLSDAQKYCYKSVLLAKENNYLKELAEAYGLAASIAKKSNDFKTAYTLLELYSQTNDSVNELNNKNYVQELAARMEVEQNKLQIKNLEQQTKLNASVIASERSFKFFLIVVILILLVLAFIILYSFLQKRKDNRLLENAYSVIEQKNKDISDSIDYALHIQQARLPHVETIKNCFPEFFVLYLPRDTVSGDFYWFSETESKKKIFAVADCTGHGIPGAFMSMMGIDGLNYTILEKHIESPAKILTHVNKFIIDSLKQNSGSSRSKDGMDAVVCVFNEDMSGCWMAGANRPMWLVRQGELMTFLPDKMAIGGYTSHDFIFQEQYVTLQKGDCIYLFSDGYPDQFGGEQNKKFMTKNLKQLFAEIAHLSDETQQSILHTKLQEWKGDIPQIDDIIVVGIKV